MSAADSLQPLQVAKVANPQALASRIHYQQGLSAGEVRTMDPVAYGALAGDTGVTQEAAAGLLRAYENYR